MSMGQESRDGLTGYSGSGLSPGSNQGVGGTVVLSKLHYGPVSGCTHMVI